MNKTTKYTIIALVGMLVLFSYFRIQEQNRQTDSTLTLLTKVNEGVEYINAIFERQTIGQERQKAIENKTDILVENMSKIIFDEEQKRKDANITTVGFVKDFNRLITDNHNLVTAMSQIAADIKQDRLESAQEVENDRTMFQMLDSVINATKNNTYTINNLIGNLTK